MSTRVYTRVYTRISIDVYRFIQKVVVRVMTMVKVRTHGMQHTRKDTLLFSCGTVTQRKQMRTVFLLAKHRCRHGIATNGNVECGSSFGPCGSQFGVKGFFQCGVFLRHVRAYRGHSGGHGKGGRTAWVERRGNMFCTRSFLHGTGRHHGAKGVQHGVHLRGRTAVRGALSACEHASSSLGGRILLPIFGQGIASFDHGVRPRVHGRAEQAEREGAGACSHVGV